jgi:hypothetical protein
MRRVAAQPAADGAGDMDVRFLPRVQVFGLNELVQRQAERLLRGDSHIFAIARLLLAPRMTAMVNLLASSDPTSLPRDVMERSKETFAFADDLAAALRSFHDIALHYGPPP